MMYENLLYVGVGLAGSLPLHYVYSKLKWIVNTIDIIEDKVVTLERQLDNPEEIAKKILTMKIPVNELPPDLAQQIKNEAEQQQQQQNAYTPPKSLTELTYVG